MLSIDLAIFIPFLAAILIPLLAKKLSRIHIGWFVLAIPVVLFLIIIRYVPSVSSGNTHLNIIKWIPSFNINLITYVDGLSMIFGLIITGIGALVVLYSIYYLSTEESLQHFYIYLLLFMGSMLGLVFSDHLMVLYVFWELTSISSFLLIAFWYRRQGSRYGAQKSLLITMSGGFAMLIGFIMIYIITGTASVQEIISIIGNFTDHSLFIPAMILILIGAFTKSAQFPFHIWLPDAMEAPTPVSAYLHSATMVKAGIYLVARFTPIFGGEMSWFWLVSGIGLLTLLWGAFSAIRQTDLKALLAYSTVSQLGLIMSLLGVGSIAFVMDVRVDAIVYSQAIFAALFHLINHATFKGALFMIIGIVDFQIGTRDIRRLGGLMALMPISFTVALIGSFSMAGLPPFNGFLSKEMFFTAMLQVHNLEIFSLDSFGILFPIVAWVASVLTFVYSLIIVWKTFLGPEQEPKADRTGHEPVVGMLIAPIILAILIVTIFIYPDFIRLYLLKPAMLSIFSGFDLPYIHEPLVIWHGFNTELWMTILLVAAGILLFLVLNYFINIYKLFPERRSFDALYNGIISHSERSSTLITTRYMTGLLRDYLVYIYLFIIISIGGILFYTGAFSFNPSNDLPLNTFIVLLVMMMTIAGVAILFVKTRLTAILLNGFIGFSIAMLFVLFRAPDLALTQIVIETVTTALFLLSFYFLPEWKRKRSNKPTKVRNGIIAVTVGATVTLVSLSVQNEKLFTSISAYFENAYELAGGKNIVNTILADFRAFDTMLEVIVLFIAGIGVYSLIHVKRKKEADDLED